jgi:hypothetical protein
VDIVTCWRCEQPGHGYAECQREPAKTISEVENRNARHVERWITGAITLRQKTEFVKAEWKSFHSAEKEKAKK